jgi:hypothetical protein
MTLGDANPACCEHTPPITRCCNGCARLPCQTAAFADVVESFAAVGTHFRYVHAMNSAGVLLPDNLGPVYHGNMARTGALW